VSPRGASRVRARHGQQQRVVAAGGPPHAVWRGEQRVDLLVAQERDGRRRAAFGWDREHARDRGGVLGVLVRGVAKQRADRRQPRVASRGAVVALMREVVEERANQLGVQVGDVQLAGRRAGLPLGEGEQQTERVAVCGDRVRAGVALAL
jgi:hypothetical protein